MSVAVKICGLSTAETVEAALAHGADFIGLNFYRPSPRYVSLAEAGALARLARGRTRIVALAVDGDDAFLDAIATQVGPDYFQLHGSETPARVAAVAALTGKPVIKAIKVGGPEDVAMAALYVDVAEFRGDFLYGCLTLRDVANIGLHKACTPAGGSDFVADGLRGFFVFVIQHHGQRAGTGQRQCHGAADVAAATGNQRNLAGNADGCCVKLRKFLFHALNRGSSSCAAAVLLI